MPIGFRAFSQNDVAVTPSTLTITLPTGTLATDIVVVVILCGTAGTTSTSTYTPPAGWTAIIAHKTQTVSSNSIDVCIFWALGNVASKSFTRGGANTGSVGWTCAAFSGVDNTTPIDVAGTSVGVNSANSATAGAMTIATANAWEMIGVGDWNGGAYTATGFTVVANTIVDDASALMYNSTPKATGSTGTVVVHDSASATNNMLILMPFALRPAAGTTYDVTPSDSATLSDTAAGAGDFPRSVADSVTAADIAGGGVDRTSTDSDSVTVADAAAGGVDRTGTLSDSVTLSIAAAGALDFTLAASVALTLTDAAAGGVDRTSTVSDAVTVTDANTGNLDHTSVISDSISVADAAAGGFDITVSAADSLSLAAVAAAALDASGSAAGSVSMSDAGGANLDASGAITDAMTVADTAASQADFLNSLADALTLSDAAAGDVTSGTGDVVSIRERIERVVRTRVATIYGVGRAFRWDMGGVIDPATGLAVGSDGQALLQRAGDALVLGLDENKIAGQGTAVTAIELALQVQVKMGQDADETVTTSELLNRWLLRIERAVMANPEMWEGGTDGAGVRLAVDTIVSHTRQGTSEGSVRGGGEAIAAVDFVIEYQHFRNDPYAGPGIARVSLPAIDEFAAAGTPDPEDDTLSIKERIEQLIQATMAAVDGVGRVFRWDMRGLRDPGTGLGVDADGLEMIARGGDALVLSMDETAEEGAQGSTGMTIKTLGVRVEAKSSQDADLQQTTEAAHTSWLAKFENALLANPRLLDGQGAMLAIDVRVSQTHEPPRDLGQIEAISAIDFEIEYEHYRNDPAAGPGVTQLIEA